MWIYGFRRGSTVVHPSPEAQELQRYVCCSRNNESGSGAGYCSAYTTLIAASNRISPAL